MLVLTSSNVQYCQLSDNIVSLENIYPGISYQGLLFVRVSCFSLNQLRQAIAKSRQFLDLNLPIASIVVKEEKQITVWSQTKKLDIVAPFSAELALDEEKDLIVRPEQNIKKSDVKKYRGAEIAKAAIKPSIIDVAKIAKRKKKLKYRGSSC